MLFLIPTKQPHTFVVKQNNKMIGRLYTLREGAFYIYPKEPYFKLYAFGILKELLESRDISFKVVLAFWKGKVYRVSRKKMIREGIPVELDFGIKLFVPIKYWEIIRQTDNQTKLEL